MSSRYPVVYIARAVLEAATPLSVSTGSPDGVFDTALVRDANGLPAIPGTSLAGVLRHLWIETHGGDSAKDLFGFQERATGRPSRLTVSWGALLDSQGRPAEGLLIGAEEQRLQDPLYACALAQLDAPVFRNRVRLTHRGAAVHAGKFDRGVLSAGNRFAVELRLWAEAESDEGEWVDLLGLLGHPGLRLGGATRAGLGKVRCVSLHHTRLYLRDPAQAAAFRGLGRGLADTAGLTRYVPSSRTKDRLAGTLTLEARGLWRIGQGDAGLDTRAEKPADLLPVTEERVDWGRGEGERTLCALLIPASSLKGAVAHRTAFHARRFSGAWADEALPAGGQPGEPPKPAAVEALLGDVERMGSGRAGCLFIDDAFLPIDPARVARLMHNAIDRFTGGVRDRVLYEEESLYGGTLEVPLALDLNRLERTGQAAAVRRALRAALDDLCQGRLALGSRTTTGNGFFSAGLSGDLAGWLYRSDELQEEGTA